VVGALQCFVGRRAAAGTERFIAQRQERWERLQVLLKKAGQGQIERMSAEELFELGDLYRQATSDLAIVRRDFPGDRLAGFLNDLVARAHPIIYHDEPVRSGRIRYFLLYGYPLAVRQAGPYILGAFAVSLVSAIVAAILVAVNPPIADTLLPGTAQSLRSVMEQHHLWVKSATENHSVAGAFIMTNNIRVAFMAFAGGMLAGVGAFLIMAYNGLMLGAVGAMVQQYGLSEQFWAFVAPHGVIELTVIFIAGGAGLMIGDALLRPGLRRRSDALTGAARHAAVLLIGCVPLLMIAGTIEAFFSPSDAPAAVKFAFAAIAFSALYGYLLFSRPPVRTERYTFDLTGHPVPSLPGSG
jgi:uncharacterized membrane protein SpoIIM required for sporulation